MRKSLLFMSSLIMCGVLGACNGGTTTSSTPTSETPITVDWDEEDYVSKGGSFGGYFIDVNVGRCLSLGKEFTFVFSSSHATDKSYTISVTNNGVLSVNHTVADDKNFGLIGNKVGDAIVTIENASGILVYRNIMHVRRAVELTDIGKALFNIDKFYSIPGYESFVGSWTLSFTDQNLTGVLKGNDDYEYNAEISFSLTYSETVEESDLYVFEATEIESTAIQTEIGYVDFSRCLDWAYVYDTDGNLITMLIHE